MSDPIDRILAAARSCFAAKGFAGTTIADIETAAGYSPRAGGMYRHFKSKKAILEAVIDAELASNRAMLEPGETETGSSPVTPPEVLERVVRRGLAQLDRQADLMRIVFRDLDQFPDLLARFRAGLTNETYRDFADRLALAHLAGRIPALDFEAVAVLAIGPVVDFKIKQHMLGFTPLDLSEERFVQAWVRQFSIVFGLRP
jgi:AcrR family transcriptional regulator